MDRPVGIAGEHAEKVALVGTEQETRAGPEHVAGMGAEQQRAEAERGWRGQSTRLSRQ